jgi:hypothetical protein
MAFDVVMFGAVSVPEEHVEQWLESPISVGDFPWLEEMSDVEIRHQSPRRLLDSMNAFPLQPHHLFEVSLLGGRLKAQCYVGEDCFRATNQSLALLFASSGAFGGSGELFFVGYQGIRFGEQLMVHAERNTLARVSGPAWERLEQHPQFVELNEKIHARFDGLVGRDETPGEPRAWQGAVNPFTGRRVRVAEPSPP